MLRKKLRDKYPYLTQMEIDNIINLTVAKDLTIDEAYKILVPAVDVP